MKYQTGVSNWFQKNSFTHSSLSGMMYKKIIMLIIKITSEIDILSRNFRSFHLICLLLFPTFESNQDRKTSWFVYHVCEVLCMSRLIVRCSQIEYDKLLNHVGLGLIQRPKFFQFYNIITIDQHPKPYVTQF